MPTCPCGSTDVEEVLARLTVTRRREKSWGGRAIPDPKTQETDYWARICQTCSQVTFWAKPSDTK